MQSFSRIVSVAIGNFISASIIGGTVVVGVNRREARRNIIGLTFLHASAIEYSKRDERIVSKEVCKNLAICIETQQAWLHQPVYKQFEGPPMPL